MRKRTQRIHDGRVELTISRHAIDRFRFWVAKIRPDLIPAEVARMMRDVTPIHRNSHDDNKIYLSHKECVFVIARRSGVLVTVLPPDGESTSRFSKSYKDQRSERRTRKLRSFAPHQRPRQE